MMWFRKRKPTEQEKQTRDDLVASQESVRQAAEALQNALLQSVLKDKGKESG